MSRPLTVAYQSIYLKTLFEGLNLLSHHFLRLITYLLTLSQEKEIIVSRKAWKNCWNFLSKNLYEPRELIDNITQSFFPLSWICRWNRYEGVLCDLLLCKRPCETGTVEWSSWNIWKIKDKSRLCLPFVEFVLKGAVRPGVLISFVTRQMIDAMSLPNKISTNQHFASI